MFCEHIERFVWTRNYAGKGEGKELVTAIQKIPQMAVDSFGFTPWLPRNYVKTLPAGKRVQEKSRLVWPPSPPLPHSVSDCHKIGGPSKSFGELTAEPPMIGF